jgi:hypothetical protein
MKAVLICQPCAAKTCFTPARVPNTTWWHTDQTLDGLGFAHLARLDRTDQSREFIQLDLTHVHVVQR